VSFWKEVAEWCRSYFQELYNEGFREEGMEVTNAPTSPVNESVLAKEFAQEPSEKEVKEGVKKLKNGKAAGTSGIVGEMLKAGNTRLERWLVEFFRRIWREEKIPEDWKGGIVIPLYKKGDRMDLNNYRGITLMDVVGKLFGKIVNNRLEAWYRDLLAEEQAGFRKGRGCVDQGYTLAQVVLKRLEMQKDSYLCFVDLRKAYDSVWREGLFQKLEKDDVPQKLVRLVKMWYETVHAKVRVNDVDSEWFETKIGLRQGDTLSPLLFNIFINGLVEKVKSTGAGARLGEEKIAILLFADDMVLLAESEEELMRVVEEYCKEWHLEVNVDRPR